MGTKVCGLVAVTAFPLLATGFFGPLRPVGLDDVHCALPSAISASDRPVVTEASISARASPSPGTAWSSFSLISSQLLRLDGLPRSDFSRTRAQPPFSRSPSRSILTDPLAKSASKVSGCRGVQVPVSHSCTVPAP